MVFGSISGSRERTLNGWKLRLAFTNNPRHYLSALKSNLQPWEKVRLIRILTEKGFEDTENLLWLENQLISSGHFELAQSIRLHAYDFECRDLEEAFKGWATIGKQWCRRIVELDIKGRWIVQREIFVQEELQGLRKSVEPIKSSDDEDNYAKTIAAYEKELATLNEQYWTHHRYSWKARADMPKGAMGRAFLEWRKNPDWYLTRFIRQDCAGRGGCCGRYCGCCEKPRNTARGEHRGHCTSACGCCVRTRGVGPDKFDDVKDLPFNLATRNTMYSVRLIRAYIYGLDFYHDLDSKVAKF